jgi:hypothetical protein
MKDANEPEKESTMRTKLSLTAFVFCALPGALLAQSTSASSSMSGSATASSNSSTSGSSGANSNASTSSNARIQASYQHAAQIGIPTALLENKVAEGQAKGVSQAQIATAVEHRLELLQSSRTALMSNGQAASAAEMNAGADAIAAGATLTSLLEVRSASGAQTGAGALTLLARFVQSGEASGSAVAHVETLLQQNPALVSQANIAALANIGAAGAASQGAGTASQGSTAATVAGQASGLLHIGHN